MTDEFCSTRRSELEYPTGEEDAMNVATMIRITGAGTVDAS
jgi:hypothetical protein